MKIVPPKSLQCEEKKESSIPTDNVQVASQYNYNVYNSINTIK